MFRAREITHPEVARDLLDGFAAELDDVADIERRPALEGRFMSNDAGPFQEGRSQPESKGRTGIQEGTTRGPHGSPRPNGGGSPPRMPPTPLRPRPAKAATESR